MSLNWTAWQSDSSSTIDETTRAIGAWRRIQRDPQSIALLRAGVAQTAITVRIEHDNGSATASTGDTRTAVTGRVIVFGIRNHPTLADTDMQQGDRFVWEAREYEVKTVRPQLGEIQVLCEVME
jgi:hypothetical protein